MEKCQGKICRCAADGHVPASEIKDDFVWHLHYALAPGVEKHLRSKSPSQPQNTLQHMHPNNSNRWREAYPWWGILVMAPGQPPHQDVGAGRWHITPQTTTYQSQ